MEPTNSALPTSACGEAESAVTPGLFSVRVSSHGYLSAFLLGSFLSGLLFYLQFDILAISIFAVTWIILPALALSDKVTYDGRRLTRTGLVPRIWAWLNSSRNRLKITHIEQVETEAVRTLKRGNNIYYRYRTVLRGKGSTVSISSGGDEYRRMLKSLLRALNENVLDTRSIELRDHLSDPKASLMRADSSRIPSPEMLETEWSNLGDRRKRFARMRPAEAGDVDDLRNLANELRLSGYLLQSLEAFRRALVFRPGDANLLFEFARCLHSFAGVKRDPNLERRALAALRLSERRAADDSELLTRLAEWYFQIGHEKKASSLFQNVLERFGESFRAFRGLAEIALRDGKIAHVTHHFSAAVRSADTPSLRRWSKNEADYFSNLHSDGEYMELEISRVNMLEGIERSRKTALRITLFALPLVLVGVLFGDNLVANVGWTISCIALVVWIGLQIAARTLSYRIPYELMNESED